MRASCGLYPYLGQFFRTLPELASAGCMSERRLRDCLDGAKTFTQAEKKAISANIVIRLSERNQVDMRHLLNARRAWNGEFDEIYKRKVG